MAGYSNSDLVTNGRNIKKLAVINFFLPTCKYSTKTSSHGHYFTGISSMHRVLFAIQDDCDRFKEIKTCQTIFSPSVE